ncbi:MAG: 5-methyltetrahydropteroyltriglutamate--homocysteine S-methyltransferase [Chitinophagaceae bacterium]|nr:5-methyltetrahydropteroyltriglutamate--homocysteine S-methyltransferase [Chitinophagaceae bacterium]
MRMLTHNLGYPRIGNNRELKKACEQYWAGKTEVHQLEQTAQSIRAFNWKLQQEAGINWIPCNDFSFYDQVLDTSLLTGAIPQRYSPLIEDKKINQLDLLFAMARGYQQDGYDITAMEMTKWFDTNYHYIVPEFAKDQHFSLFQTKILREFAEAKRLGIQAKPVLLGPVSFLLLGKEKEAGFHRIELLPKLLPVYIEVLKKLDELGAYYVQLDEPCLSLNLTTEEQAAFTHAYRLIKTHVPQLQVILASYFECYGQNLQTVLQLPVHTLHLDLVRCPSQLDDIFSTGIKNSKLHLSLGIVDGRNIWKNDYQQSLALINKAIDNIGSDRVWLAPSCSLLHVPCDLDAETSLNPEIRQWMAFAKQKLDELSTLKLLANSINEKALEENKLIFKHREHSALIHRPEVKERLQHITAKDSKRQAGFDIRKKQQQEKLRLPLFPTTTIGSFPQTKEVRSWRAKWKKKEISNEDYNNLLKAETEKAVRWQEEIGLDVLVHGEFERNDMVEYFGEQLAGFVFTENGWVQSYGSRCVKPPVIYGDVFRPRPMTVEWSCYAQSLTSRRMKGMLTGPVTMLQWSFVRNDQPRSETCRQIALAIRDEVVDLEKAGIRIIQIDEPAIREGLPLRRENWQVYLDWAVESFRLAASGVQNETQIHTHMCYSEFNDIISSIADMDADVITIETSRSQMELLQAFAGFRYPNDIGPGVYDIHSPRIPTRQEMLALIEKALAVLPSAQLWINPDCGLKTRGWNETRKALIEMVGAAKTLREAVANPVN